ncbi:MAG: HD domain-containing protein [Sporomusaceae bacterium]|nr:HD domain-containing protein [Sporomusaceae bacterium]
MNHFIHSASGILTTQADLYDETGILLIAKGMPVTREIAEKLQTRKLARPAKSLPAASQAESGLIVPERSDHPLQQRLAAATVFATAARVTQQAIEAINSNSRLTANLREVVRNQAWVYDHSVNAAQLATQLALQLALPEGEVFTVSLAALLHDIGRTVTETATTSFVLTKDELRGSSLKHHPVIGSSLLQNAGLPESVWLVALQHHERFSGQGYPRGLRHDETHWHAQIVMMADVFEALTTRRLNDKTFGIAEGLAIVNRGRGRDYHPDILDALTGLLQEQA